MDWRKLQIENLNKKQKYISKFKIQSLFTRLLDFLTKTNHQLQFVFIDIGIFLWEPSWQNQFLFQKIKKSLRLKIKERCNSIWEISNSNKNKGVKKHPKQWKNNLKILYFLFHDPLWLNEFCNQSEQPQLVSSRISSRQCDY